MNNKKKGIGYYVGYLIGAMLLTCIAVMIGALALKLTLIVIGWLF